MCDDITHDPAKSTEDLRRVPRERHEPCASAREPGAVFFFEIAQQRHTFIVGTSDAEEEGKGVSHVKVRS